MKLWATICLSALLAVGCSFEDDARVQNTDLKGWQRAAIFDYEVVDTAQRFDIEVLVRYYPVLLRSDSLRLNIVTTSPSGEMINEVRTIRQLHNRMEVGESGYSAVVVEEPYRKCVQWSESGVYSVAIFPTQPTDGVEAVGLIRREFEE